MPVLRMRVTRVFDRMRPPTVVGLLDGDEPVEPGAHFLVASTGQVIRSHSLGFECNSRMTAQGREWTLFVPEESTRFLRPGAVLDKLPAGRTTPRPATDEDARTYLELMSPGTRYNLTPFPEGWVLTVGLTAEQKAAGQGSGSAPQVLDARTGYVYGYPSWPVPMVAESFVEARDLGLVPPDSGPSPRAASLSSGMPHAASLVYPHQWWVTADKEREDAATAEYRLRIESLREPTEPAVEHRLTLAKDEYFFEPTDRNSARANARLRRLAGQSEGGWPERTEYSY